jgi:hypothetical protein
VFWQHNLGSFLKATTWCCTFGRFTVSFESFFFAMNRSAFGLSLLGLALAPLSGGCGLYVTTPPTPAPVPTPVPTPGPYPFDETQGVGLNGAPTDKGLPQNGATGLPTSFRAADVVFAPRSSTDTANYTPLLVLQSVNTDAKGNAILGTAEVNNPVRLAGVIVPAPNTPGYEEALQATRNWAQGQPVVVGAPGAPSLKVTPTPAPARGTAAGGTATISALPSGTALPLGTARGVATTSSVAYIASQPLDVFQDPKYPIDSENRRLVQAFFTSKGGGSAFYTPEEVAALNAEAAQSAAPGTGRTQTQAASPRLTVAKTSPPLIKAGTALSINRMLIRSGWAVVDLYSPTSFDQQAWLLDESYARKRRLGLWRYGVALQQRVPEVSTGTGALSTIPVTVGTTGTVPGGGKTRRGPATAASPRIRSGSSIARGRSSRAVLPPASTAPATGAAATSSGGSLGSSPSGSG